MDGVRLDDLRTRIRRRAKIERQTKVITSAELDELINTYGARMFDIMSANGGGSDWFVDKRRFATVSGVDTYPIADWSTNFYRGISVDVYMGSSTTSDVISARQFSHEERNLFKNYVGWGRGWPVWYRFIGKDLIFQPAPTGAYTIQVNYIPTFTSLVSDSDKIDVINGWDDYVVWNCAADCRAELDLDPTYQLGRAQAAEQHIRELADRRDERAAPTVRDVTTNYDPRW